MVFALEWDAQAAALVLVPIEAFLALVRHALAAAVGLIPVSFVVVRDDARAVFRSALTAARFVIKNVCTAVDGQADAFAEFHVEVESIETSVTRAHTVTRFLVPDSSASTSNRLADALTGLLVPNHLVVAA